MPIRGDEAVCVRVVLQSTIIIQLDSLFYMIGDWDGFWLPFSVEQKENYILYHVILSFEDLFKAIDECSFSTLCVSKSFFKGSLQKVSARLISGFNPAVDM